MHNKRPEVSQLFGLLVESMHELSIQLQPEAYWNKLFPNHNFSDLAWRRLRHRLLSALEDYLVFDYRRSRPAEQQRHLLDAYEEAGLYPHLRTRLNRYKTDHSSGLDRYRYAYRHQQMQYKIDTSGETRGHQYNLQEQETSLEGYVLALSLRQACISLAYKRIQGREIELPLLSGILQRAKSPYYANQPGIRLFYLVAQMYLSDAEMARSAYEELRVGLMEYGSSFPHADHQNLLLLTINHSLRESNAGQASYLKDTLELYRYGLQTNTLLEGGRLGQRTFNNIVGVALRLGELKWTREFIDKYESRLHPQWRQEISSLSRARIAWLTGDYDATLAYLQTADYQDPYHQLTARVFQLKVYFAKDAYSLIEAHLRSSRAYMRRRKLGYHRDNYQNIFSLASRVARLGPGKSKVRDRLYQDIQNTEPCTEKSWLLSLLE
ncbi:MAG: hypothetical protein AAFY36_02290 [Bacteroidota bacterium]